ncbi:ATP-dependent nuclease [Streptomyces sp. NPDC101169]|uniref:ATP-dependent nuclease n=1 Tax=Streptomyces sp. NPDC101169 TaxID=3366121 RepID=UPI00380C065B
MESFEEAGNAGEFSIHVPEVEIIGGGVITLPKTGVTAIVGPNNAGKSTLLREIAAHIKHGSSKARLHSTGHIVERIQFQRSGSISDAYAWVSQHAKLVNLSGQQHFIRPGAQVYIEALSWRFAVDPAQEGLNELSDLLVFYGDAWQRMAGVAPVELRDLFNGPATSPLHVLQDRRDLFNELCNMSREVFGQTLTLDRLSKHVNLRVGETVVPAPSIEDINEEYWQDLSSLPHLTEQGDGMKSLIGLLVPLVTSAYPIVFIDEPEAFLHPPQAMALGRILGEQAKSKKTQIVLATHDRNILSGLLQSQTDVSIVRLERASDGRTRTYQLNVDELRDIWDDAVLRYSNVLDGLFHKAVVLAEAERDCKFYSSALEEWEPKGELPILPGDVLFVPSGGKDGFPRLAKVLRSVRVPVVVSPDLDILNDGGKLRVLVKAMGGDWSTLQHDYTAATAEFRQPRETTYVSNVLSALNGVFSSRQGERFTTEVRHEFMAQLRNKGNPWSPLKDYGELAFRADPTASQSLLDKLASVGIVAVRVGELERFAPQLGVAKGPAWLPAAIAAGYHKGDAVRRHVASLVNAAVQDRGLPARPSPSQHEPNTAPQDT